MSIEAAENLAKRSRFTPRTANYLLRRARDIAQMSKKTLDEDIVVETLKLIGIDEKGLSKIDIDILDAIHNKFGNGPVGVGTLATSLSEESATIEEFHEPYLIQLGFIERTSRGRLLTNKGIEYIKNN
jgi:Holliday junction DNA helicase RuvB